MYSQTVGAITADCYNRCRSSGSCNAFWIDYVNNSCYRVKGQPGRFLGAANHRAALFTRICMQGIELEFHLFMRLFLRFLYIFSTKVWCATKPGWLRQCQVTSWPAMTIWLLTVWSPNYDVLNFASLTRSSTVDLLTTRNAFVYSLHSENSKCIEKSNLN